MESRVLDEIKTKSLASILPGFINLALEKGQVRVVLEDTVLFQEGEEITHYLMPLSEHISLTMLSTVDGSERRIGYVQRHRSIGLRELLKGLKYAHSGVTETTTSILYIPKQDFLDLVAIYPRNAHYLLLMTESSALRGFKHFLSERGISQDSIFELFSLIQDSPSVLEPGEELKRSNNLFFVKSGALSVVRRRSGDSDMEFELGEGSFFGGEALVPPHKLSYTVKALDKATIHKASLQSLGPDLQRLGVTESIYDEPWFPKDNEEFFGPVGDLAALPGIVLSDAEAVKAGVPVLGPSRFKAAKSDRDSYICTLLNVAALSGAAINAGSAELEFRMMKKITALSLSEIIEPYGFYVRELKCELASLDRQPMPSLCLFGTRLCGLLKVTGSQVVLLDSARGTVQVSRIEFSKLWNGSVLEMSKADVGHEARNTITDILWKFKPTLANVVLLSLGAFGLNLIIPLFSQHILDEVLSLRDERMLVTCITGLVLTTFFNVAVLVAKQLTLSEFSFRYDTKLSVFFYRKALSLPTRHFQNKKVGEILTRLSEIWIIRDFLSGQTLQAFTDFFSILVYAIVLCFYSWKIALIPLALFLVVGMLRYATRESFQKKHSSVFDAETRTKSLLSEQIGAIGTIKALGAESVFSQRWEEAFLSQIKVFISLQRHSAAVQTTVSFLAQVTRVCGVWIAADFALKGEFSAGQILAISMYLDAVIGPVASIASLFSQLERVKVAFRKVEEIMGAASEHSRQRALVTHSPILSGKIKFDRVNFRYSDDSPWVVQDLSFTIYPKQVVAIVGRSGCGKTTLANLISGNLKPTSGRIFFDDFDSGFLSLTAIRKQIGFIMQSADLFSGTISDNIAYSDVSPEDEEIEQSAIEGNAAEFISKFPAGYKHYLGEGGLGLSGGQKQRVSIARTLYRKPKILLMDEATSAMDADSERKILENMKQILKGKTAVIIAHRLSTIRGADKILVMKDGQIIEDGNHADLLKKSGYYSELFEGQLNVGDGG